MGSEDTDLLGMLLFKNHMIKYSLNNMDEAYSNCISRVSRRTG